MLRLVNYSHINHVDPMQDNEGSRTCALQLKSPQGSLLKAGNHRSMSRPRSVVRFNLGDSGEEGGHKQCGHKSDQLEVDDCGVSGSRAKRRGINAQERREEKGPASISYLHLKAQSLRLARARLLLETQRRELTDQIVTVITAKSPISCPRTDAPILI